MSQSSDLMTRERLTTITGAPAGAGLVRHSPSPALIFWFSFWLALILIGAKVVHIGWPDFSVDGLREFGRHFLIVTHADVLFVVGVGILAYIAIRCAAARPKLRWAVWAALFAVCLVSAIFAIASVQIFSYLQSPLTFPLLYLAGDVKNMRSSVGDFLSPGFVLALVGLPIFYFVLAWASHRFIQIPRFRLIRAGQSLGVLFLVTYVAFGRINTDGEWNDRNDRRLAENPHWTFVTSCLIELFGERMIQLNIPFPPEDLDDFRIVAERESPTAPVSDFAERPKNVIVFVLESTGTQFLSLYGSPYPTTPRLEAEAAHSVVFDNFYCQVGLTANALVALTLSIYPGMTWREYTVEHPTLPGTSTADVLGARGYRTAFIHNGDLGYTNQRGFLTNRGFDTLWDYRDLCDKVPDWEFSWGVEDKYLVDGLLKWIDQDRKRPFFALTWTIQAHHPYTLVPSGPDVAGESELPGNDGYHLRMFLNIQREVDRQIGRLFDGLRERGLADDTLVVITGDHGEAFGFPHDTNGHGSQLYEENVSVPLILWNPKLFGPGSRSKAVGAQIDLNPTILDILGVHAPASWQGRSMLDPNRPQRAYFYAANNDYLLGVRDENWKYVYNATLGRETLFDLDDDPDEQRNIAADHSEMCYRLRQRLAAWLSYENTLLEKLHRGSQTD